MEYSVMVESSLPDLTDSVNNKITQGFVPVGGIAVERATWTDERKGYEDSVTWYYQAMLKH